MNTSAYCSHLAGPPPSNSECHCVDSDSSDVQADFQGPSPNAPLQYQPILLGAVCLPCTVATSPSPRACFLHCTQQSLLFPLTETHKPLPLAVQSLSRVRIFATPWTAAYQGSLSLTISRCLLKFTCTESIMLPTLLGRSQSPSSPAP